MAKKLEHHCQEPNCRLLKEHPVTLYHFYHSGPWTISYSTHTTSDSATNLRNKKYPNSSTQKPISKYEALDNPRYDPRTETAPYYVHLPPLLGHCPPFTLHRGGTKDTPVIALLHPSFFNHNWKLEFGDILAQPGVIDSQGVVSLKYGTKTANTRR
jgi:hypothetical protein